MSNYIADRKNIQFQFNNRAHESDFEEFAMDVFRFQFQYNHFYRQYCELVGVLPANVKHLDQIPFLPIEFFKTHEIKTGMWEAEAVFKSSATTGQVRSKHHVRDLIHYLENTRVGFEGQFNKVSEYCFIAILPGYVERPDSSLIFMIDDFVKASKFNDSGFYLRREAEMLAILEANKEAGIPTVLFGVSFALLDLCSLEIDFPDLIVIETGGMKNSEIDLEKEEIISRFKAAWNIRQVSSEYGMTELLSQSYAEDGKWFRPAKTKRVVVGNLQDPFALQSFGKTGILKVMDLANYDTCSFIETQDLGVANEDGEFQVLGRMSNAELRGCNLLL